MKIIRKHPEFFGCTKGKNQLYITIDGNTSLSFTYKNIIGRIGNDGTRNTEIWAPLKYLSIFWRTLELPLINCENSII